MSVGWEDDQYDPEFWEDATFMEGDEELDFNRNRASEEQPENEEHELDHVD